jgi:hypothetical protein
MVKKKSDKIDVSYRIELTTKEESFISKKLNEIKDLINIFVDEIEDLFYDEIGEVKKVTVEVAYE